MRVVSSLVVAAVVYVGVAVFTQSRTVAPAPPADLERAYRANNIGVALLEQFAYDAAVQSFEQALQIAPDLAIARLNLAIALLYAGRTEDAVREAQAAAERLPSAPQVPYVLGLLARSQNRLEDAAAAFMRVLHVDSGDVGAKVNLGQVRLQQRNYAEARALFQDAVTSEPSSVTAAYGLAIALTREGGVEKGRAAMERFEALRDSAYGTTFSPTYLEQGKYAEALASTGAEPELVDPRPPAVTFTDATATMLPSTSGEGGPTNTGGNVPVATTPSSRRLTDADVTEQGRRALAAVGAGGVTVFDADGDGDLDLLSVGPGHQRFLRNAGERFVDVTDTAGLSDAKDDGVSIGAVAGDYDNDGRADLFLLRYGGNTLLHQRADGTFEDVTTASRLPAYRYLARTAAFIDVDHDGDLDIFVGGFGDLTAPAVKAGQAFPDDLPGAANQLLRNNGNGTFTDTTAEAHLEGSGGRAVAIAPTDYDNRRDIDILVAHDGAPLVLFQNVRDGTFRDAAAETGLPPAGRYTGIASGDVNKDGYTDFFFSLRDAAGVFALSDGRGRFVQRPGPDGSTSLLQAQFVDYDNDGLLDLVGISVSAVHVYRNLGDRWTELSARAVVAQGRVATPVGYQSFAAGDVDGDGDTDLVIRLSSGELRVMRNDGGNKNRSLTMQLRARVSNRSAVGSKVELRAGSLRQKLETSSTSPAVAPSDVIFGLGARLTADVVRILWPAGILQAETDLRGSTDARSASAGSPHHVLTVLELDRKPSSCPYLYTWNGTRFEFVTDFMGGGEMGYWLEPGVWNHPDPDEYVRIRGDQLVARGGRYELRVTNELEESLFVDRLQLVAVDHPAGVEAFPNEGLKPPPLPPFKVTTTRGARPPVRAVDEHGHDVLARVSSIDRRYPDDFGLTSIRGYAKPHALTLDLGADAARAVLLLTGWTDYAFSSDNVAAHQSGVSLQPPLLEARAASGAWRTLVEDIGIPVGRPQTIVVDLRGRLRPAEREVRILTNMRIYWDQILVDTSGGAFPTRVSRIEPVVAALGWRGFSAEVTPDGREPFGYDYDRVSASAPWKVMTGRYTREGDVRALLRQTDDMFVIARPGDEIAVSFEASAFPALAAGWTRTFLLYADGFSKEMNLSSASPDAVEPLPFHGMRGYPYGADERYPRTKAHAEYLSRYNTRVVGRTLPPLETIPQ